MTIPPDILRDALANCAPIGATFEEVRKAAKTVPSELLRLALVGPAMTIRESTADMVAIAFQRTERGERVLRGEESIDV